MQLSHRTAASVSFNAHLAFPSFRWHEALLFMRVPAGSRPYKRILLYMVMGLLHTSPMHNCMYAYVSFFSTHMGGKARSGAELLAAL